MFNDLAGVEFWYDYYGPWFGQASPGQKSQKIPQELNTRSKKEPGSYFEVTAIQASSVTLTIPDDKSLHYYLKESK